MGAFLQWGDLGENSLLFDVVTGETQTKSNTVTEHPVEAGANITDHVRPNLDHVTIEGFISNTPIYDSAGVQDQIVLDPPQPPVPISVNGAIDAVGSAVSDLINPKQLVANVLTFPSAPDFVAQTISTLEELRIKAILITVVCPNRTYENMLVEEFEVQRDAGTGTGASFSVQLREIRVVSSSIVAAPKPSIVRGNTEKAKGGKASEENPPKKKSLLKKALG